MSSPVAVISIIVVFFLYTLIDGFLKERTQRQREMDVYIILKKAADEREREEKKKDRAKNKREANKLKEFLMENLL